MGGVPGFEARLSAEAHVRIFEIFIYEHSFPEKGGGRTGKAGKWYKWGGGSGEGKKRVTAVKSLCNSNLVVIFLQRETSNIVLVVSSGT